MFLRDLKRRFKTVINIGRINAVPQQISTNKKIVDPIDLLYSMSEINLPTQFYKIKQKIKSLRI